VRSRLCLFAAVAMFGVGACTSNPGARAVARDQIEALQDVSEEVKSCMRDKLESYSNEELEAVTDNNEELAFDSTDGIPPGATEEFTAFVEDLATCASAG